MSFARKKSENRRSVGPNLSANRLENNRKPLTPLLLPQVPAREVAANRSLMNSNFPNWNADVSQYYLFSLKDYRSDIFDGVFYFETRAHQRLQVCARTGWEYRERGACTCSYRFHALTADKTFVLAGGLNVEVRLSNEACPVSSAVERIGLVLYSE